MRELKRSAKRAEYFTYLLELPFKFSHFRFELRRARMEAGLVVLEFLGETASNSEVASAWLGEFPQRQHSLLGVPQELLELFVASHGAGSVTRTR